MFAAASAVRRIIMNDDVCDVVVVLKCDGVVFLKDVVLYDVCDVVFGELNVICDFVKVMYGDVLRRIDVKFGFDGVMCDLLL